MPTSPFTAGSRTLLRHAAAEATAWTAAFMALAGAPGAASGADAYSCTVNSTTSSAAYNVSAAAPFTGTMIGDTSATPPTRTKTGSIQFFPPGVNCGTFGPTQNDPLNISGSLTAGGSGSNIRPSGSFVIAIDPGDGTAQAQNLALNLLGTSTVSISASLSNFRYPTFCTINPTCSAPFLIPITLPLGNLTITSLTATQTPAGGVASGTLTPNAGGGYDFAIPMVVTINTTATFSGAPFPIAPQDVPVVFSGTIVPSGDGSTATVSNSIELSLMPPSPTDPLPFPPTPITTPPDSPLCPGINLILSLTVTTTTVNVTSNADLIAGGTRFRCPCDWNQSGGVSVQDVFDFLAAFFGGNADFNGMEGTTVQDIFDFLACYFTRPFPC